MKRSSKNFVIPLVIYPFDIFVSIGQSDEEFKKFVVKRLPIVAMKTLQDDSAIMRFDATTTGRTVHLYETGHTVIRFRSHPKSHKDHGIISHEIFHATVFILSRVGIQLEIEKSDECYAYLVGHITSEIYKKL